MVNINLALKKDFSVCGWWSHSHLQTHNMDTPNNSDRNICQHTQKDTHLVVNEVRHLSDQTVLHEHILIRGNAKILVALCT